jgi:hypothetical protein
VYGGTNTFLHTPFILRRGFMFLIKNYKRANRTVFVRGNLVEFDVNGVAEIEDEKLFNVLKTVPEYTPVVKAPITTDDKDKDEDTNNTEIKSEKQELNNMSIRQLEKYAKDNNIDLGKATKKSDIIKVIKQTL